MEEGSAMSSRASSRWQFPALFILGSCSFFSDNESRSLEMSLEQAANKIACQDLSKIFSDLNAFTDDEVHATMECHAVSTQEAMSNVRGIRSGELSATELRALLNAFYFRDNALSSSEVSGLLALRDLFVPGNPGVMKMEDFSEIPEFVRKSLPKIRRFASFFEEDGQRSFSGSGPEFGSPLLSFLAILSPLHYQDEGLEFDAFIGLAQLLRRAISDDLSHLKENLEREHLEPVFLLAKAFLGYSHKSKIPFRGLNQIAKFLEHTQTLKETRQNFQISFWDSDTSPTIDAVLSFQNSFNSAFDNWFSSILSLTGYKDGGSLKRTDFVRFLSMLKGQKIRLTKTKTLQLDLDPEFWARALFDTKNNFVGLGSDSLGYQSLLKIGMHIRRQQFGDASSLRLTKAARSLPSVMQILELPEIQSYMNVHWDYLLSQGSRDLRAQGLVDLESSLNHFYLQSLVTAYIKSYDQNQNGLLDLSSDANRDEFKRVLKALANVYSSLQIQTSNDLTREEKVQAVTDNESSIAKIIEDPKIFSSLVLLADNFGRHSNSDGAINGSELTELLSFVENFLSLKRSLHEGSDPLPADLIPIGIYNSLRWQISPDITAADEEILWRAGNQAGIYAANIYEIEFLDLIRQSADANAFYSQLRSELGEELPLNEAEAHSLFTNQLAPLKSSLNQFFPSILNSSGVLPSDSSLIAMLALGTTASNIYASQYPSWLNGEIVYSMDDPDWGAKISADSPQMGLVTFEMVQAYFNGRLNGQSFAWLPPKLRLALVAAPPELGPELVSRLLWHASEILQSSQTITTEELRNLTYTELLERAYAIRNSTEPISYRQLQSQMIDLSLVLGRLQGLDR